MNNASPRAERAHLTIRALTELEKFQVKTLATLRDCQCHKHLEVALFACTPGRSALYLPHDPSCPLFVKRRKSALRLSKSAYGRLVSEFVLQMKSKNEFRNNAEIFLRTTAVELAFWLGCDCDVEIEAIVDDANSPLGAAAELGHDDWCALLRKQVVKGN